MQVVSVRERPELAEQAIAFFQEHWATGESRRVYDNCIRHAIMAEGFLPQWYLLTDGGTVAGGAGLIPNDFISRADLCPWFCALYVEPAYRGHGCSALLLDRAQRDAAAAGYGFLYLCTDLNGFYERMGGEYIGVGYHPWGERSRIYRVETARRVHTEPTSLPAPIRYDGLTPENFGPCSLDGFIRHQEVRECWRRIGGDWALVPVAFTEEWSRAQLRENADALLRAVEAGAYACGAFCGQTLVGYLLLLPERFGSRGQYMELKELYVSEPFRGRGIGRELFGRGAAYARTAGASKLYISAHSSRESQAAYRRWGCVEAAEPDRERAAREPCDVQMEYPLGGAPAEVRVIEDLGGGAS